MTPTNEPGTNEPGTHEPGTALDPELQSFLASRSLWHEPDPRLEDAVIDAVAAERSRAAAPLVGHGVGEGVATERRHRTLVALAAAAAVLVVAGTVAVGTATVWRGDPGGAGVAVALAATTGDPSITTVTEPTAMIDTTPTGVRIVLDTADFPPAPSGAYYQVWLVNDDDRVSAGTFLGGGGQIELWCGVDDPGYRTVAVTIQAPSDGGLDGTVVLEGHMHD